MCVGTWTLIYVPLVAINTLYHTSLGSSIWQTAVAYTSGQYLALQQSVPSWQTVWLGTEEELKVLHSSGQMALKPCPVFTPLVAGSLKDVYPVFQGSKLIDAWGVDLKSNAQWNQQGC